eukprot:gene25121-biopygen23960
MVVRKGYVADRSRARWRWPEPEELVASGGGLGWRARHSIPCCRAAGGLSGKLSVGTLRIHDVARQCGVSAPLKHVSTNTADSRQSKIAGMAGMEACLSIVSPPECLRHCIASTLLTVVSTDTPNSTRALASLRSAELAPGPAPQLTPWLGALLSRTFFGPPQRNGGNKK